MNTDKREFLSLTILPARLSITEAAWFLGFTEHDISRLVSDGILKPLGRPPMSGSKYFATKQLELLRSDLHWLARASDTTVKYWQRKNAGRLKIKLKGSREGALTADNLSPTYHEDTIQT